MAAAIEGRTAEARTLVEGKPHRQRRYRSATSPRPRRSGAAWKTPTILHALSALRFPRAWQRQVGEREGLCPLHRDRLRCRAPAAVAVAARAQASLWRALRAVSWAASMSTFNMALWDRDFAARRNASRSRRADRGDRANDAEADVLALHQQPLRWRDAPNPLALLPHQPSANDCPVLVMEPGAAPATLHQQLVPATSEGQGAQAAAPPRLSLSRREHRGRHHAAARLVLPHQAAADGGAETAQRVRRSRRRGFHPQRLHPAAAGRQPRHRYPRPRMRRGSDRDLRRRRRRPSLLDDVQHLHDVGQFEIQPRPDPDARHHRSLCRATDYRALRSRDRFGRLQAAVLQERRADLRQLHSAQPRAAKWPPARCRASTAPSGW